MTHSPSVLVVRWWCELAGDPAALGRQQADDADTQPAPGTGLQEAGLFNVDPEELV
jgi:hypothetical protein